MRVFADASALVAILGGEPEKDDFVLVLRGARVAMWSAMSCWETVLALRRTYQLSATAARKEVELLANVLPLIIVGIGETERRLALDAYERYGKGVDPARLNFGDCFAYACAKANDARLLYKGNDFAQTDLA